jgi:hypothetical protein
MRRQYRGRYHENRGLEAAKRHIEEAKKLTEDLGGTDQDVKQWFFNLAPNKLEEIFVKYTNTYGSDKGKYARATFADWKSSRTQMSGVVASRLFDLLPPVMPLSVKFQLVESLWHHVAPAKKRVVVAGTDAPIGEIIDAITIEVRELTTNWEIPTSMQNRFKWLAHDDSQVYQNLLKHIKDAEKNQGELILKQQIPILKQKFDTDLAETTYRLSYVIEVGKQSVELRLLKNHVGISVANWFPEKQVQTSPTKSGVPGWVWIVGLVLLLLLLSQNN